MNPDEIKSFNERSSRLSEKLDKLEELMIDKLVSMLESTEDPDRDVIQVCSTAAGVLKANKRAIPQNLPNPLDNPTAGLVEDPEELPTTFSGERR